VVRAIEGEVPLQVEQAAAAAANHRCLLADLLGVCFGEQEGNCQFFRGDLLTCCLTSITDPTGRNLQFREEHISNKWPLI
jgi:hypothetical protein